MKPLIQFIFSCFFLGGFYTYTSLADAFYADNAETILKGLVERSQNMQRKQTRKIDASTVTNHAIFIDESPVDVPAPTPPQNLGVNLLLEFDVGSAALRAQSYKLLSEAAIALGDNSIAGRSILINGHTDSDGSEGYNLDLSLARANAVKRFILAISDIDQQRLKIQGFGESLPVLPNTTGYNKQRNRRVQLQLL